MNTNKHKVRPRDTEAQRHKVRKNFFLLCSYILFSSFLHASDNDYYFTKSDFYLQMQDFSSAQKMINKIDLQKLNKNEWATYYNKKGFIDYKLNHFVMALSNYFTAKKYNPKLDYLYNNIGVIYFQLNNFEKAKEYYLNAISLNSNYTKVLVNLAVVDFYMRNYITAFNWFKKALSKDRGYIKERWDREKALKKLIELSKKYPEDQDLKYILEWAKENYNKDITGF